MNTPWGMGGIWVPVRRFGELKRLMLSATQKMLTGQLRLLERDGLVSRKVYPEVPPKLASSIAKGAVHEQI
ncbi:MAG TPA: winged helix-turn-helix transcriptional regulator [Terriglobales bacterium]|nr:winged helix-turn-helix transcriptional regulator [Terriglobales bacterium]